MGKLIDNSLYNEVKSILEHARLRAYTAVNFAMVEAYWHIGRLIVERQGGDERAEYGKKLMLFLAGRLTKDYGKGFDERNLRFMRQFYLTFPIWNAVRSELSWTHYRLIMKVENSRLFYIDKIYYMV